MTTYILASASPRRQALIELLGLPFRCVPSNADETLPSHLQPEDIVQTLAYRKAMDSIPETDQPTVVVGADTIVVYDDRVLGKPVDETDAVEMLTTLQGKTHRVYTGVCIADNKGKHRCFYDMTEVTFYPLSREEIEAYVESGEPMDKAGAYGIQEKGALLVEKINGDYFNVVGLPIALLARQLADF
ncbi:MAG: septum formation inhibitor Maf [Eubacteriaceae bacterium]|jgi:septum formation protein|nr:septum formation inhibitor Maf [Eubacteriaceae bacterium]